MPDASLLEVKGIDAFYGDFQALFDVSLSVDAGQIVAVIGANGAGKSTLLKSIAGLTHPHRGEILFDGTRITDAPAFTCSIEGLHLCPKDADFFLRCRSRKTC